MTSTLAAAAADFETPDYDVAALLSDCANGDDPNPLAVRDALIELARLSKQADEVDAVRKQIVERYADRMKQLAGRAQALRDSLQVYAERYGKASFPDVGGIHLTTQNKGGKAVVVDAEKFEAHVRSQLVEIAAACVETVEVFDKQAALGMALDEFGVRATASGAIVDTSTGEDVTEKWANIGVGVVAESKSLAVRKS